MSLVSSYVKMADGKWYQNPVIYPESGAWYICFDDDDPIELVIKERKQLSKMKRRELVGRILRQNRIKAKVISYQAGGQRLYPPSYEFYSESFSVFLKVEKAIDSSNLMIKADKILETKPEGQGVYYEWRENS